MQKLTAVDFVIIVWARIETKLIYFVASKYTKISKSPVPALWFDGEQHLALIPN